MAGEWRLITDDTFRGQVGRFKYEARAIVNLTIMANLKQMQTAAVNTARDELKRTVYDAPIPESVLTYEWWTPTTYMQQRRLGRVWRAVKADPIEGSPSVEGASATVRVAKEDFPAYYYAWVLNHGSSAANYTPRPYWTVMEQRMRQQLRAFGTKVLRETRDELLVLRSQ